MKTGRLAVAAVLLIGLNLCAPSLLRAQDGALGDIRSDVRATPAPATESSGDSSPSTPRSATSDPSTSTDELTSSLYGLAFLGVGAVVTTPIWMPIYALDDHYDVAHFQPFPYAEAPGRMIEDAAPNSRRQWGGRLRFEYANEYDAVEHFAGGLLLEHQCRLGLDTEAHWLHERLIGGGYDRLWLGDANLVFRFAQNERMQWRTGVGLNWLADRPAADLGFNFTYGFDWFPARPLVVATELDWGTLGTAGLFRFRTTGGLLINRFEAFTGYEYLDIGRTQTNSLLAGLRIWF